MSFFDQWFLPSVGIGVPGVGIPGVNDGDVVEGEDGGGGGIFGGISDFLFGPEVQAPPLKTQLKLIADAYNEVGPQLFDALLKTQKMQAASDFDSANTYAPKYTDLEARLQEIYGPRLAAGQAASNAVSGNEAAKLEQELISKYGPETARAILATTEAADPTGTAARAKLVDLFNTYTSNLSPTLNGSERAEINRSLAQQNPYQVGSQLETIQNAQTFGNAGTEKLAKFGEGAAKAAALLPAVSSGVNPFSVSTLGRAGSDTSASIIDKLTGRGYNDAGTAIGVNNTNQLFGLQNQANAIDAMNKDRGFLNAWTRFTEGLGNLGQAASGFAAACWIARAVFGYTDPRWLQFRDWLMTSASPRLREWYLSKGPRVAAWVAHRPVTKQRIKAMMMEAMK